MLRSGLSVGQASSSPGTSLWLVQSVLVQHARFWAFGWVARQLIVASPTTFPALFTPRLECTTGLFMLRRLSKRAALVLLRTTVPLLQRRGRQIKAREALTPLLLWIHLNAETKQLLLDFSCLSVTKICSFQPGPLEVW